MTNHDELLDKVALFEKIATGTGLASLVQGHKSAIGQEIAGGIRAVNKIMTSNPKAAASEGIQRLDDYFGQLGQFNNQLDPANPNPAVASMLYTIGEARRYTISSNAGFGYDSFTQLGGSYSPAAYLVRIETYVKQIDQAIKNQPKQSPTMENPKPTNIA